MTAGNRWAARGQTCAASSRAASECSAPAGRPGGSGLGSEQDTAAALSRLVAQEVAVCEQLQELAKQEERALVGSDLDALSRVVEHERRLTERLLLLEEARTRRVEDALSCAPSVQGPPSDVDDTVVAAHLELVARVQRLSAMVIMQMRLLRQVAAVKDGLVGARASVLVQGRAGQMPGTVIECQV